MLKKRWFLLLMFPLMFFLTGFTWSEKSGVVFPVGKSLYIQNGTIKKMAACSFISNGRAFVPVRYFVLSLGIPESGITWCQKDKKVKLYQGNTTMELYINQNKIKINQHIREIDVVPILINGRIYLPARFVAEAFGFKVKWDVDKKAVVVETPRIPNNYDDKVLELIHEITRFLAKEGVPDNAIDVEKVEFVNWPDASMGCPASDQSYAQILTPGYVIVLKCGDTLYEFHASAKDLKWCQVSSSKIKQG